MKNGKIKSLKQVLSFLNNINFINCGGCGIAALAIYKWLEKNEEETDPKFIFLYFRDYQYEENCSRLNSSLLSLVVPAHIGYKMGTNYYIDSQGTINVKEYNFKHEVDLPFLIETINRPFMNGWNGRFDRKNISLIEKQLGIDLSEIKQN